MNQKAFTPLFWRNANICLHSAKRAGFTLLELIIVVIIIGILATLAIPQYVTLKEKAIAAEAIRMLGNMKREIEMIIEYYPDMGNGPSFGATITKYWLYLYVARINQPPLRRARALRRGGAYDGSYIEISWDEDGIITWSGNHPCVPKNPE